VDFDLAVLLRRAQQLGVPLALGRGPEPLRLRAARTPRAASRAVLSGRLVLDGIELLRGAFVRLESYGLDAAAREILGRGKTIEGPDRAEQILRAFERDRARLVDYNLNDARLVLEILDALHLIELVVERSRLTGMPPDRVGASIAAFDFLYLSELSRRGLVAPTVASAAEDGAPGSGGHVLEPRPGLYPNVIVLDFKSLYPSIIRTFQIDPLGHVPSPGPHDDAIVAPNGAAFRRQPGILPCLLDALFPRREAARAAGDRVASQAIKILMNSFYGVLGAPGCRFASPALANAITSFGREILLRSKSCIEAWGHTVLYGDTDSLFVLSGLDDAGEARRLGGSLARRLDEELARWIGATWSVPSRLELQFERLYRRLLLPATRHGTAGARKRYAGLVEENGRSQVVFTGMEVVRRDWTELARRVQRELYERLFADQPVEAYLRGIVDDLRAGRLDPLLVYRKALRKRMDEYAATTPPHVAAARKMHGRRPRVVAYVMTRNGPEPAGERRSPIDHEHYVQRQVRAVAEPVLALVGLDFDRVVGDRRQLDLF
jgi:DNA polymerase-2